MTIKLCIILDTDMHGLHDVVCGLDHGETNGARHASAACYRRCVRPYRRGEEHAGSQRCSGLTKFYFDPIQYLMLKVANIICLLRGENNGHQSACKIFN